MNDPSRRPKEPGPAALRVLRHIAIASAPGGGAVPASVDTSIIPKLDDLVTAAIQEKLTGPLLWAVDQGLVELAPAMSERLVDAHVDALAWCLRVESHLWEITGWLEAVGVRALVVKGPAIAHLDEEDASMRCFADLDLLVRGDDLPTTLGRLAQHGAVRPYAERRRGFDKRFAKSVTVTFPDRVEIDVHRTICDGVHGVRLPVARLHESTDSFELGGRTLHAPGRTARTLHAAYHAVLGSPTPRIVSLRDIVGYLRRAEKDGSVATIVEEARLWGGEAVLATAVREAQSTGVPLPQWQDWVDHNPIDPAEEAIIAAQRRDGSSFRLSRLKAAKELGSARDRLSYLTASAFPSTTHLRSRGRSRLEALRPGAPAGDRSVVLPDFLPPEAAHDRLLVVSARPEALDIAASRAGTTVHAVTRGNVDHLRRIWSTDGTVVTVTGTPRSQGTRGMLREIVVASGELRRFDPDRVQVGPGAIWLVAPALVFSGRRRELIARPDNRSVPGWRGRAEALLWALARRRHHPSSPRQGLN